jgi:hypothetical protein
MNFFLLFTFAAGLIRLYVVIQAVSEIWMALSLNKTGKSLYMKTLLYPT